MSLWSRIERTLSDLAEDLLPDEFRIRMVEARDLLERGMPEAAAAQLEELVHERPKHAGALSLLGAAQLELGQARAAASTFSRALAERPDAANALVGLGQANLLLGQADEAVDGFRAAVACARGDRAVLAEAYRGLGQSYRRVGDLDKAIRELRKAVAENEADPIARAALGEALLADERVSAVEAARHLDLAVKSGAAPALAYVALGRIALEDDDAERARIYFEEARERARGEWGVPAAEAGFVALLGLGDACLLAHDIGEAHRHLLEALAKDERNGAVHARIGDIHRASRNPQAALQSYERALALGRDRNVLRRALDAALEADDVSAAVRLANELLADDANDARAMVARGMALARQGDLDAARATFETVLRMFADAEAHLALGQLELDADPGRAAGARAAACALAALRDQPESARARELLVAARARELGEPGERRAEEAEKSAYRDVEVRLGDASEMYRLAERFGRMAVTRPELGELAREAAQAVTDFDQPLLVTVMGEFSSGKSSFVNAFIGDEVAPTGITPTTATINIVKYGRERGGRILYRDGAIETLGWSELFPALQGLSAERARRIELVEILLPLSQLERVNIVDTPGLNSILPEHEEVARGFIARADAVVWLFTANQAGKASERKALAKIQDEGKRVLGVLNKKDQLSENDVAQLIDYVQGELAALIELVVPFSARDALAYKRGQGSASDGNWSVLEQALEARFFTQARELKRDACSRRLQSLLARARGAVEAQHTRAQEAAGALREQANALMDDCAAFIDRVVVDERRALADAVEELYRRAAREVLELVRPRELPFGSHSATPADRDYLLSLLDTGYEAALERSRRQVVADLERRSATAVQMIARFVHVVGDQTTSDVARTAEDAVRLVQAQVFDRARAFVRGYLHGGFVSSFFRRDLPKLELDEESVYQALFRDAPELDAEIALPLARAGISALETLARRLEHWAGVAEVTAFDIETGLLRALDALEQRRRRLTDAPE